MRPETDIGGGGLLRRLAAIEQAVQAVGVQVDESSKATTRLDEQINGERGLSAAVNSLSQEIAGLRRAAWAVVAIIITSAIGFAFSVLTLL